MTTQAARTQTNRKVLASLKARVGKPARFCTSAVQISGFLGALVSVLLDRLLF